MSTFPHTSVMVSQWSALADDEGRGIAEAIAEQFSNSDGNNRFALPTYLSESEVVFEADDTNNGEDTKRKRAKSFGFYQKAAMFWDELSCEALMIGFLMVVAHRVPETGIRFTVSGGKPELYRLALEMAQAVEPGMPVPAWVEGYVTGVIKPNPKAIAVPAELDFRS